MPYYLNRTISKIWILFFLLIIPIRVSAAFEKVQTGASSVALGNALVARKGSDFALYYNPALLSVSSKFTTVFSYQTYFGFAGISQVDIITFFHLQGHPFSIAINRFGTKSYQEIQLTIGSKYQITDECAFGVSVQTYYLNIKNYGNDLSWGLNISAFYQFLPNLAVGAIITNVNQPNISSIKEKLPQTMTLGVCYNAGEDIIMSFDLYRDIRFGQEYRAGISYDIQSGLTFRAGIEDGIETYSFGIGIDTNHLGFDYGLKIHQILGISHIISLSLRL